MSLLEEKRKYPIIKDNLKGYKEKIVNLYEIAWKSWDRDPENHDGAPSGIMEMYEEILRNLEKNKGAPYFARIVFQEDGDEKKTDVYIGKIGHVNLGDTDLIDWRAPISDLYYNAPLGQTSYISNGEEIKGTLDLKRQIKIDNDEVTTIYDFENTVSSDEFLKPYLTQSADNRLKNIVSTIQAEQNQIIRLPIYTNTVVQGVAGSGKTTVALHRLSYLMYTYKDFAKAKDFLIISPNSVFMSYISSLLVDLDADQAYSYNLEGIYKEITENKWKILNKHEQYEKLILKKVSPVYLKFKSSKEFAQIIDKYIEDYSKKIFRRDLVIDGVKVLDKDIMYNYYKQVKLKFLQPSFDAWVRKVVFDLQINTTLQEQIEQRLKDEDVPFKTRLNIMRIITRSGLHKYLRAFKPGNINPIKLYAELIKDIDKYCDKPFNKILKHETLLNLKEQIISYEDMFPIMYISLQINDIQNFDTIKHVFIDEAQDISYLGYLVLRKAFPYAYFSIFGDLAQGLYSYQSIDDWTEIEPLFEQTFNLPLNKSYRTSIEIMEEANKTLKELGMTEATNVIRHGDPVEFKQGDLHQLVKEELNEMSRNFKTVAIICKDKEELSEATRSLQDIKVKILDENNSDYKEDETLLLTVQTAKGLEFDFVIIYNENSYDHKNKLDLKQLFVAKTRALHKLVINKN